MTRGTARSDNHEPDFERLPGDGPLDETDVNLRAYFARLAEEPLAGYDPAWSDERDVDVGLTSPSPA